MVSLNTAHHTLIRVGAAEEEQTMKRPRPESWHSTCCHLFPHVLNAINHQKGPRGLQAHEPLSVCLAVLHLDNAIPQRNTSAGLIAPQIVQIRLLLLREEAHFHHVAVIDRLGAPPRPVVPPTFNVPRQ
ncbi:hypothetical protein Pelo_5379 [Pelomyxa schiedti]|nr:hypothetical protein Pelo_5379 [Pelomyxa schiedti]